MRRFIGPLISILIIVGLIFGISHSKSHLLVQSFRENLENQWQNFLYFFRLQKRNIATEINPPRKPPLNLLIKEDQLRMAIGEPFLSFSRDDWKKFWDLIYGTFEDKGVRGETIKRQRTESEIQDYLKYYYPKPFFYFQKDHWKEFWKIIYSKKSW